MASVLPIGVTPQEAVAYFRRTGYQVSFAWQDMMYAEHARAFTVAKMMRVDLLTMMRQAVDDAIANGTTLEQFQRDMTPLLQREGWWGRQLLVDPRDGQPKSVQLGSPRRLETIYDTNLRTSYAAGKWEQHQRTKRQRPYLRYIHLDSPHPRRLHKAWNGLVLPIDHPFWRTHYPPNGWHCHCTVQQLGDRDLERWGYRVSPDPVVETVAWRNPRTGEVRQVPDGIDPGFDYNPGIAGLEHFKQLLDEKLLAAPADLREALR